MVRSDGNGNFLINKVLAFIISLITAISITYNIGVTLLHSNTEKQLCDHANRIKEIEHRQESMTDRLARIETKLDLVLEKVR